ncbi:Rpb7-binding seb1 [Fusarium napiforme]|uniref:Rpb7-binding seb1 n=1 Tax=Fusarium napiforme TaxID=42672 RepID=A0A8H5JCJ1_9HYPO|nr:Rpb7-binding seb1 [Fusarium napiforme]
MASAVADLEAGLQAMLNLKPPGVSGSRITSLTSLCVSNIQAESVLIQKIFTHFKKTPGTHKLGVLYVVDSVTRKWLEQAKAQAQTINSSAPDGTYAAGVNRVTELMPVLMNDILQSAPEEQKEKIKKLLDIWEKGQTFPTPMLESFREKLNAPPQNESTTPPGSPPPNVLGSQQGSASGPPTTSAAPAPSGTYILEALANLARQNTTAPPANPLPAPTAPYSLPAGAPTQPVSSATPPVLYPPASQPVNVPSLPFSLPHMGAQNGYTGSPLNIPSNPPNPVNGAMPGVAPGLGLDPGTQQQIILIKALADQGIPFDKIPALIQSMGGPGAAAAAGAPPAQQPAPYAQSPQIPGQAAWGGPSGKPEDSRMPGYGHTRSPPRFHGRSRSRSPDRGWGGRGSPRNGRDRLDYARDSPNRGRHDDRRGGEYRQRSPHGHRGRSETPLHEQGSADKWVEYDPNLPSGHIKVYSRTLFVGGVTCSESELRGIFGRFGTVQTCIVNKDKRHAFVKMLSRQDAVNAKQGTEDSRNLEVPLRTRWGVGFGPRDCSDYSTGVSVIPIHKLTEADRKWMLTAPFGGSGGQPIETGLSVEEPDIEIGAGVSSKAISRRMQTDKGGSNGPKSTRNRDEDLSRWRRSRDNGSNGHNRRDDHHDLAQDGQNMVASFPFGIGTLPNGMPNFPAGFTFPDPTNK